MRKYVFWIIALVFLAFLIFTRHPTKSEADGDGRELIGTKAKEWEVGPWFHSPPLHLENLKGKVVLVRFWTAPGCPFCAASAPALNEFYEKYHPQGLEVVGFYHHKSPAPLDPREVEHYVEKFGFKFPVAIDHDWKTLRNWWLEGRGEHAWTSVSFLVDQKGVIRHIHPGGEYVKGDRDYAELRTRIEELLSKSV